MKSYRTRKMKVRGQKFKFAGIEIHPNSNGQTRIQAQREF